MSTTNNTQDYAQWQKQFLEEAAKLQDPGDIIVKLDKAPFAKFTFASWEELEHVLRIESETLEELQVSNSMHGMLRVALDKRYDDWMQKFKLEQAIATATNKTTNEYVKYLVALYQRSYKIELMEQAHDIFETKLSEPKDTALQNKLYELLFSAYANLGDAYTKKAKNALKQYLQELYKDETKTTIILIHEAELAEHYAKLNKADKAQATLDKVQAKYKQAVKKMDSKQERYLYFVLHRTYSLLNNTSKALEYKTLLEQSTGKTEKEQREMILQTIFSAYGTVNLTACNACGQQNNLKKCTRCCSVVYCCVGCQTKDYAVHKLACLKTHEQASKLK